MQFSSLKRLARVSVKTLKTEGWEGFRKRTRTWVKHHLSLSRYRDYKKWRAYHDKQAKAWFARHGRPVTIVIPSYNDTPFVKTCLESLERTLPNGKAKIILVDDKSPGAPHHEWLKTVTTAQVIFREKNGGFGQAVNTGLSEARKLDNDVILLNSDIEAQPCWLENLQYAAYREPDIGITGPKLVYPDGRIQSAGSHRNEPGSSWFDHYFRFKPASYGPANVPADCIAITGACQYIKAEVLAKIGLLDEGYSMGFEDVDYCLRAWEAGYRTTYWPFSELIHHESVTRGKTQGPRELASQAYFWKKWKPWFDDRNVRGSDGRTRVIYVMEETGVAGGHRNIFDQLNRLVKLGYAAELWALDQGPSWFRLEVPVRTFPTYKALATELAETDAVKVATWWKTGEWVWRASVRRGIAAWLVQDIESSYYADDALRSNEVLARYRREFLYFTISQWNVEQLRELNIHATLQHCGIDLKTYRVLPGVKRQNNVLLTAGRANPLKNLPLTLAAWRAARNPPELWMYGFEPELARGLKNCRYFTRPSDEEINQLLNQATAFILTSRHEGFALTILEAMAAGCPVICTDADGNRDFCVDGKNCLIVGKEDEIGLTRAIEKLFDNPHLQESLRTEGYKTARAFDWDLQVEKLAASFTAIGSGVKLA